MARHIGRPRALDATAIEDILSWYRTHRTLKQVAQQHGVSPNTVRKLIREHFPANRVKGSEEGGSQGGAQ